jgi:hypothetical protein
MNVASLLQTPRTDAPAPSTLRLLRLEASVLTQALLGSARESVLAFRFMRGLLLQGGAAVPPVPPASHGAPKVRALA